MKILFVVPYSSEGASNRYRVEQYLSYLDKNNIYYEIRPFIFKKFYKIIYSRGKYFKKILYFLIAFFNRLIDICKLYKYDVIFIHRESFPFGPPFFEWLIYLFKKPIVFDFDDAIFLPNSASANRFYRFLKFPCKTKIIIKLASKVVVANKSLGEYASRFNKYVYIIPTSVDIDRFNIVRKPSDVLIIGWIGSPTTSPYLEIVFNIMQVLSKKYDFILKIVGAGRYINIPGVKIENYEWALGREVQDFQSINIGIYPLPNNQWAYCKAAFKAIQYMAVGVPVVASPIGMNKEIIQDGVNGFLADSEDEWIEKLSRLIEDVELRERIGLAGRKTVEEKFSVKLNFPKYLDIIKKAIK